jgi:23S rRNA pseudouridine1911/1915/1917 synthase
MQCSNGANGVIHVLVENEASILAVATELGLNVDELFPLGAVFVNNHRCYEETPLKERDYIRLHSLPRRFQTNTTDWKAHVVFEDGDFVLLNKPAGIPTIATVDNTRENAHACLQAALGQPLFVTHRLDHATSGLVLFAKGPAFQTWFNKRLIKRQVAKTYLALIPRAPRLGTWTHYMETSTRAPKVLHLEPGPGRLVCETEAIRVSPHHEGFEIELSPRTGRTHQLRAQLAFEGAPIYGDSLYHGGPHPHCLPGRIALHAWKLSFPSPSGGSLCFEVPPPWNLP